MIAVSLQERLEEARQKRLRRLSPWVLGGVIAIGLFLTIFLPRAWRQLYVNTPTSKINSYPTQIAMESPGLNITPSLSQGINSSYRTEISPIDNMIQVNIPAGEFWMGSDGNDPLAFEDEKPPHSVYLDEYWIDQTEVTNILYAAFLNALVASEDLDKGCNIIQSNDEFFPTLGYTDYPVACVNWYSAEAYCEWAGRRLPTEAEWEKAARGFERRLYPWGNEFECSRGNFDDETKIDDYVVSGSVDCDGYERTAPAGSFPSGASPYGVLDMAGNVWEWLADWYGKTYYSDAPDRNPNGPTESQYRVLRGGAWLGNVRGVRSAYRGWGDPGYRNDVIGFRCARSE